MAGGAVSFDTRVWDKLFGRCLELDKLESKIGIQGDKAQLKHEDDELTNVEIAAIHEFNEPSDTPPGRPFVRPVYDQHPEKWKAGVAEVAHNVIQGANPTAELRRLGEEYRKEAIDRVKAGIAPPLADSTIARRNPGGKGKREKLEEKGTLDVTPLIDTGTMIGAVDVVVAKR